MIDRDREDEARKLIRDRGYEVMPFGFTEWAPRYPRLAAKAKTSASRIRVAPDSLVETAHGLVFLETVFSRRSDRGDRSITLAKLAHYPAWAALAPVLVLDMSDGGVWQYDAGWPYAVTGTYGPTHDGPRGPQKACVWLPRTDDGRVSDYWP